MKMRLIFENANCKHFAEKPQLVVCEFGFYDCHACERQIHDGELYFLQRQVGMTLAANWWMKADNHWEISNTYDAKLCRDCGNKKHRLIHFEPFICKITRKNYLVITDDVYTDKPQFW
jgi:hypothetical protein